MGSMIKSKLTPHPRDVATRKALAKLPPPSLELVLRQAKASHKARFGSSSNGPKPASA
jgi:hypothetical protein